MRKMCAKLPKRCGYPKINIQTCCVSGLANRIETTLSDRLLTLLPDAVPTTKGSLCYLHVKLLKSCRCGSLYREQTAYTRGGGRYGGSYLMNRYGFAFP